MREVVQGAGDILVLAVWRTKPYITMNGTGVGRRKPPDKNAREKNEVKYTWNSAE